MLILERAPLEDTTVSAILIGGGGGGGIRLESAPDEDGPEKVER
jgi:hypothetical protein